MALPPVIPPIPPPTGLPPAADPNAPPPTASDPNAFGSCLSFLATLLLVGAVAELLFNVSPRAAYLFILLVIMGYAATGKNLEHVTGFFSTINKG